MKKQWILAACLALSVALLSSCGEQGEPQRFEVMNQAPTQEPVTVTDVPMPTAAPEITDEPEPNWGDEYDPTTEEGRLTDPDGGNDVISTITAAPTANSVYAGASPVVIDPIDKPTPSPVPALTISSFATYDALNIGMSFEAPAGWESYTEDSDAYTIKNPDTSVDFQAFMTITLDKTSGSMNKTQMATAVKGFISALKESGEYKSISATNTANRSLFDAAGVYADYTATTKSGAKIYGRVHIASVSAKQLITVHTEYPYEYREVYKTALYNKMRSTIKLIK